MEYLDKYLEILFDYLNKKNNTEIISTIVEKNSYEAPVGYKITMNTMRQSGFLRMIAIFQILSQKGELMSTRSKLKRLQIEIDNLRNESIDEDIDIDDIEDIENR